MSLMLHAKRSPSFCSSSVCLSFSDVSSLAFEAASHYTMEHTGANLSPTSLEKPKSVKVLFIVAFLQ